MQNADPEVELNRVVVCILHLAFCISLVAPLAHAQNVRDHTRVNRDKSTAVSESQATELTLTRTAVAVRPIQVWVRTAGAIDKSGRALTVLLSSDEGALVKAGQRVRAFPPETRATMYQARVTQVARAADGRVAVTVTLVAPPREGSKWYVMEIVTDHGELLSVPNEALIETAGKHVVYVDQGNGRYLPREVTAGVQGELYTQVLDGLKPGEQVVTFGSFFIDADYKLRGF